MELLTELDLDATNQFFAAFFRLPTPYWQGFLASRLSSARLIVFAAATFVVSPCPPVSRVSSSGVPAAYGCSMAHEYVSSLRARSLTKI